MRLVLNPLDNVSFKRVINVPTRGIGASTVILRSRDWRWSEILLFGILRATFNSRVHSQRNPQAGFILLFQTIDKGRKIAAARQVSPILQQLLTDSGYMDELKAERTDEAISRLENLQELLNVTAQYDETNEEPSLAGFLESVTLISDVDSLVEDGQAVSLMTLHSSKGLEFPVVFLVGLEEGVFPHSRSLGTR